MASTPSPRFLLPGASFRLSGTGRRAWTKFDGKWRGESPVVPGRPSSCPGSPGDRKERWLAGRPRLRCGQDQRVPVVCDQTTAAPCSAADRRDPGRSCRNSRQAPGRPPRRHPAARLAFPGTTSHLPVGGDPSPAGVRGLGGRCTGITRLSPAGRAYALAALATGRSRPRGTCQRWTGPVGWEWCGVVCRPLERLRRTGWAGFPASPRGGTHMVVPAPGAGMLGSRVTGISRYYLHQLRRWRFSPEQGHPAGQDYVI